MQLFSTAPKSHRRNILTIVKLLRCKCVITALLATWSHLAYNSMFFCSDSCPTGGKLFLIKCYQNSVLQFNSSLTFAHSLANRQRLIIIHHLEEAEKFSYSYELFSDDVIA